MWQSKSNKASPGDWVDLAPILGTIPLNRLVFLGGFLTIVSLVLGGIRMATVPDSPVFDLVATVSAFGLATFLFHTGRRNLASHLVLIAGFLGTFAVAFERGGLASVSMHWACFVPLMAILLIGIRGSIFYTIAALTAIVVIASTTEFNGSEFGAVMGTTLFATSIGHVFETTRLRHVIALSKLVSVDPITDLPTRKVFDSHVRKLITHAATRGGEFLAFFIEIDDYVEVKETFGVYAGEALITELARRMSAVKHTNESVFHLAENRFVLVTEVVDTDAMAAEIEDRLSRTQVNPVVHENFTIDLNANMAVAIGTGNIDTKHLLLEGDSALHESRHQN